MDGYFGFPLEFIFEFSKQIKVKIGITAIFLGRLNKIIWVWASNLGIFKSTLIHPVNCTFLPFLKVQPNQIVSSKRNLGQQIPPRVLHGQTKKKAETFEKFCTPLIFCSFPLQINPLLPWWRSLLFWKQKTNWSKTTDAMDGTPILQRQSS